MELMKAAEQLRSDFQQVIGEHSSLVFTSSLGEEDQVITHLIAQNNWPVTIATLDTGRHFPQYYDLIERTQRLLDNPIKVYSPQASAVEYLVDSHGINGFYTSVEARKACCAVRKIEPLKRALAQAEVWVTGLRAEQSNNRQDTPKYQRDAMTNTLKFNPLVDWSKEMIDQYIEENKVPTNPLHKQGFVSIGCQPCTRAITEGEHPRNGRWWWESSKKECGLHT
ncbi:MAG: phosphoadenylyl-sulfate reductase [Flavobacteriales bacterium]|nr:phosphoadenylyl-sulfate reductase [Flavobacteriales bacterium]